MRVTNLNDGRIELAVGDESSRGLDQVYYDVEKGRLVATEGHILAIAHVIPDEGETSGPISAAAFAYWRQCNKGKKSYHAKATLYAGAKSVIVHDPMERTKMSFDRDVPRQFVNYELTIPQVEGPPVMCFSLSLLKKLIDSLGRPDFGQASDMVAIWPAEPGKQSAYLVKTSPQGALGIIMPMRSTEKAWLTSLEAIEAQLSPGKKVADVTEIDEPTEAECFEAPDTGDGKDESEAHAA